ncbi:uncharacterized protein LY79DRAFT_183888 [Colletotrichum navitas]|uniref:Uncharacterized protein n=1 Tax=Colletotrichum navitas TaxID=681940 RepID=A0AAD8Q0A4_9PEZI|nr:uncharacterized protein LY79DRAFT_183888 [Colletotrichum navitas]KAK1593308.1 hypothetical protein LY79DRAFT_183888 [Colletotrichum navitas]
MTGYVTGGCDNPVLPDESHGATCSSFHWIGNCRLTVMGISGSNPHCSSSQPSDRAPLIEDKRETPLGSRPLAMQFAAAFRMPQAQSDSPFHGAKRETSGLTRQPPFRDPPTPLRAATRTSGIGCLSAPRPSSPFPHSNKDTWS